MVLKQCSYCGRKLPLDMYPPSASGFRLSDRCGKCHKQSTESYKPSKAAGKDRPILELDNRIENDEELIYVPQKKKDMNRLVEQYKTRLMSYYKEHEPGAALSVKTAAGRCKTNRNKVLTVLNHLVEEEELVMRRGDGRGRGFCYYLPGTEPRTSLSEVVKEEHNQVISPVTMAKEYVTPLRDEPKVQDTPVEVQKQQDTLEEVYQRWQEKQAHQARLPGKPGWDEYKNRLIEEAQKCIPTKQPGMVEALYIMIKMEKEHQEGKMEASL